MMRSKQSILIIHPEGNIANNPNLLSLVLLLNKFYQIYIIHERKHQNIISDGIHLCYLEKLSDNALFKSHKKYIDKNFQNIVFSLIIGIDQGIKFANFIASKNDTPLALISYEIFFSNEWDPSLKQQEINACKNIVFSICQDSMRSYLLSHENNIPIEKIINIPISESYSGSYKRSTYLHEKLKIPSNKKIALYIGSIAQWTMTEMLINSTILWPEEWVLVLHPRYGIDSTVLLLLDKINENPKVFLSQEPKTYTYELEEIICSADLGLVLYDLNLSSPYTGKNILFVGLSSGKFSAFMKYDIPIVVNNNTNIADIVFRYNLGYAISNIEDIHLILSHNDTSPLRKNCRSFFKKYLDFSLYKNIILTVVEKTIKNEDIIEIIKMNNRRIDIKNISDVRMEIIYNKLRETINSTIVYKINLLKNRLKIILKRVIYRIKKMYRTIFKLKTNKNS